MHPIIRDRSSFFSSFPEVVLNGFRSVGFSRRRRSSLPISHCDGTATFHTLPSVHYRPLKIIDRPIYDIDIWNILPTSSERGSLYTPLNFVYHTSFNEGCNGCTRSVGIPNERSRALKIRGALLHSTIHPYRLFSDHRVSL